MAKVTVNAILDGHEPRVGDVYEIWEGVDCVMLPPTIGRQRRAIEIAKSEKGTILELLKAVMAGVPDAPDPDLEVEGMAEKAAEDFFIIAAKILKKRNLASGQSGHSEEPTQE